MKARSLAPPVVLLLLLGSALAGCLDRGAQDAGSEPASATGREAGALAANESLANVTDDGTMEANGTLGAIPHLHDYWDGKERVTLMDEDVTIDPFMGAFFTLFNVLVAKYPAAGGAWVALPDGKIVYEGTGQLELTATWEDPAVTGLSTTFHSAADADFGDLVPLTSGTPLVVPVTPEMCDMPHAKTSRWEFVFLPPSGGAAMGTFRLKIDIVKMRDIEKFPGHPDLFGDATEKTILDADATSAQQGVAGQIVTVATASGGDGMFRPEGGVAPTDLVPMETMELRIDVTIASATSQIGQAGKVWLLFKTADRGWFDAVSPVEGDVASGRLVYALPVEMLNTDSPYATASQWLFDLRVSNEVVDGVSFCGACFDAQIDYHITVTAFDHSVLTTPGGDDGDGGERGSGTRAGSAPAERGVALPRLA